MDDGRFDISEDSDDASLRDEIEAQLYSQIYHDTTDCVESANVLTLSTQEQVREPIPEPIPEPVDNTTTSYVQTKDVELPSASCSSNKATVVYHIADSSDSSSDDDSDIQVVREVVQLTQDKSLSATIAVEENKKRKRKVSTTESESEEDVPFWSRLDSGTQNGDTALSLNIRTHGRQRHDSLISHGSSALGEEADPLVTLRENEYETLEDILDTLPDDGWEIMNTDYTVSSMGSRKSFRYHNLKCRNCDERGHLSNVCTAPKKEKACSLCSEVHQRVKDKRYCPHALCVWCGQPGHYKNHCYLASSLRTTKCHRCKQRGHKPKMCHELWRQWHATTDLQEGITYPTVPEVEAKKDVLYCANCSYKGHSAHECKQSSFSHTNQALPVHISHYNTFGALKDFGRRWSKHGAVGDELEYDKQSHDVSTTVDEGLFVLPQHLRRNKKTKRHKQDERDEQRRKPSLSNNIISNNTGNMKSRKLKRQERKEKKLQKKIAKRDGPIVKVTTIINDQSQASTSAVYDSRAVSTSHMASNSNKKLSKKKKKKCNVESKNNPSELSAKTLTSKIIKNKKANERKKKRIVQIGKEKRERRSTAVDGRMLDLVMGSKTVKSWNDAF